MAVDPTPFTQALGQWANFDLVSVFAQAMLDANRSTARTLVELARVLETGVASNQMAAAHTTIAENAQRSVLKSYDQVVTRRKGPAGRTPYRLAASSPQNERHAGGALRRALASPDFWEATATGIRFVNVELLDREASHWARLNAGAGSRGTGSRRSFEIRWSNLVVASLGMEMNASPSFAIPRGYWFDRGAGSPVGPGAMPNGHDEFYPIGEGPRRGTSRVMGRDGEGRAQRVPLQRRRMSQGIRARNFLDAGVATIARELPQAYERVYADLFRTGVARVRPGRVISHVKTHRVR